MNVEQPGQRPEPHPVSPEEFIGHLPEGEGAGPGAPETDGHGPRAPEFFFDDREEKIRHRDELPDARGIAGSAAYVTTLGFGWLAERLAGARNRLR